jgi:hypothetical protein
VLIVTTGIPTLRNKRSHWWARNPDNVVEWSDMSIHGCLCQSASTIKNRFMCTKLTSSTFWWRKPDYPEKTTDLLAESHWQTLSHNVVSSTHAMSFCFHFFSFWRGLLLICMIYYPFKLHFSFLYVFPVLYNFFLINPSTFVFLLKYIKTLTNIS